MQLKQSLQLFGNQFFSVSKIQTYWKLILCSYPLGQFTVWIYKKRLNAFASPKKCLLAHGQQSQPADTGRGESKSSVYGKAPRKEFRQPVLWRPKPPSGFQGKLFKDRLKERGCGVCEQLLGLLLVGWWGGLWASISSTFGFQPVWAFALVGSTGLTSSIWWGFQYLQHSSKE